MVLSCVTDCAIGAVKIGHINFAIATAGLGLEGNFGLRDALFAGDGLHDVVGKRMRLPPQRCTGVAARKNRVFGDAVHHPALKVARGRAADLILRGVGRDKREALDVKVEFQNVGDFAAETFERNGDGFGVAKDVILLNNLNDTRILAVTEVGGWLGGKRTDRFLAE